MFKVKNIIIGASIGFVLSFVIGLFSSVYFGFVVLRAFIFAVVGAAFGFGMPFLFEKFLSDGAALPESPISEGGSVPERKSAGGMVDIVVEDENLEEDVGGPKFVVRDDGKFSESEDAKKAEEEEKAKNDAAVKEVESGIPGLAPVDEVVEAVEPAKTEEKAPVKEPIPEAKAAPENPPSPNVPNQGSFQPVDMAKSAPNVAEPSAENAPKLDNINNTGKTPPSGNSGGENELDVLPDIGDVSLGSKKNDNSDIIRDSEFASDGQTERETIMFPNGESAAEKNTNEMAMAIRTLLAKDN